MAYTFDDIARAIAQKNAPAALALIFERDRPQVRFGRKLETDLWDFKGDCPRTRRDDLTENGWAHLAADVVGFHNNRGGLLLFGIDDKTFEFRGATTTLDAKQFNDRLRKYIGDMIWVDYLREFIQPDQRYLGVALIPPRGPGFARFKSASPTIAGKRLFDRAGSAIRENDSTRILDPAAADRMSRGQADPLFGDRYSVDEPFFRVLAPEYLHFLPRGALGSQVERSIRDSRVAVTSPIGVGGLGKTALATWAVINAYTQEEYGFIVSTTAKDRELSGTGILGLKPRLSSYEDLLDQVLEVLGSPESKELPTAEREAHVRLLIEDTKGLLFVDNLETVDDKRLITFLDDLPAGVRALVTSRRNSVRTAARPIDIPPLTDNEIVKYIELLSAEQSFTHVKNLPRSEALTIGRAWDGIPLALRWFIARTPSVPELLRHAEDITSIGLHGDQLLEFSFRRVFDTLSKSERAVLEALSVLEQPLPTEAVVAAAGAPGSQILDAVDELVDDAVVQRVFDPDRNDYCFTVLPITRTYTRQRMLKHPDVAKGIQRRLTAWFEATDVTNEDERLLVREIRSGRNSDDAALVDLARSAERRDDLTNAEKLYRQALARNPRSWRAARAAAEFFRQKRHNTVEALALYKVAGANAPSKGTDRALIFREWGFLIRDSGQPNAAKDASEKFETALLAAPADVLIRHGLATCLDRLGAYRRIIEVLEPTLNTDSPKTRERSWPLLLKAYERTNELLKAASLRGKMGAGEPVG